MGTERSMNTDFFVTGGNLKPDTESYVTRPADRELLEKVLNGTFCYVLTTRQMGKSSLMVRTAHSLKEQSAHSVLIDLSGIGTVEIDQWYVGLLTRIKDDLGLVIDVPAWWRKNKHLGAPQRFTDFLHNVALTQVRGSIAIFIDEIDTMLGLKFRDNFFATIRSMYNARASDPAYNRLTFVLLGVATPTDLIEDGNRTPFNIGQRIVLQEFSYIDAAPLRQGLEAVHAGQSDRILKRIFYWTNGHPYLTQKLCLTASQTVVQTWSDGKVDQIVADNFFSDEARQDPNLAFVENRIRASSLSERRRLLGLYRAVLKSDVRRGRPIFDNKRSLTQNYLELTGLVRVDGNRLHIHNEIYRRVFDLTWIKKNMPFNWALAAIIILVVLLLVISTLAFLLLQEEGLRSLLPQLLISL
jgi:AAA-like domain